MKGLKELPKKQNESPSESQSNSEHEESSALQQSASESQPRSSDMVILSEGRVFDPKVNYQTGDYVMEKIKARRWNLQNEQFEYLIKWKGYSNKECTWQSTEDILGQPCLQLKDLDKDTLLPVFERTHAKTLIWDNKNNKVVKEFVHTQKFLDMYGSKQLIEEMKTEMQEFYGNKNEQKSQSRHLPSSSVKLETESINSDTFSSQNSITDEELGLPEGYRVGNIIIEKLLYYPLRFELMIAVCLASDPEVKKLLTCHQMMSIHPQTAIMCYKIKLAYFQKWKREHLPQTSESVESEKPFAPTFPKEFFKI